MLKHVGRKDEPTYSGRDYSAATSTGFTKVHEQELKDLLKKAL